MSLNLLLVKGMRKQPSTPPNRQIPALTAYVPEIMLIKDRKNGPLNSILKEQYGQRKATIFC